MDFGLDIAPAGIIETANSTNCASVVLLDKGKLSLVAINRGVNRSLLRHPRGRWRGSIRIEEQMDSRQQPAGMTAGGCEGMTEKWPGMTKKIGKDK